MCFKKYTLFFTVLFLTFFMNFERVGASDVLENDYVSDELVSIYTPTSIGVNTWKDLAGSNNLSFGKEWDSNFNLLYIKSTSAGNNDQNMQTDNLISFSNSWTLELSFYIDDCTASTSFLYSLVDSSNNIVYGAYANNTCRLVGNAYISDDLYDENIKRKLVTLSVVNNNGLVNTYLDGTLLFSKNISSISNKDLRVVVGSYRYSHNNISPGAKIFYNSLRIYNKSLSTDEITTNHNIDTQIFNRSINSLKKYKFTTKNEKEHMINSNFIKKIYINTDNFLTDLTYSKSSVQKMLDYISSLDFTYKYYIISTIDAYNGNRLYMFNNLEDVYFYDDLQGNIHLRCDNCYFRSYSNGNLSDEGELDNNFDILNSYFTYNSFGVDSVKKYLYMPIPVFQGFSEDFSLYVDEITVENPPDKVTEDNIDSGNIVFSSIKNTFGEFFENISNYIISKWQWLIDLIDILNKIAFKDPEKYVQCHTDVTWTDIDSDGNGSYNYVNAQGCADFNDDILDVYIDPSFLGVHQKFNIINTAFFVKNRPRYFPVIKFFVALTTLFVIVKHFSKGGD